MQFKLWCEQNETVPIESLMIMQDELFEAISNVYRGHRAMTDGPVEVAKMPDGRLQLVNGYHRMVEFIINRQDQIPVTVKYEDTSSWRTPNPNEIFVYQPDMQYGGLEDIPGVEHYMLRNL